MAVTLTDLGSALRVSDGYSEPREPQRTILNRLLGVAVEYVNKRAPNAPEQIKDECVIRLCGYLYDSPRSPSGNRWAFAWQHSGASGLAAPWRTKRLG